MKKRLILTAVAVIIAMASAISQQIAVVSEGGETSVYRTLRSAIESADPGSVIYLPGGGFSLPNEVKIIKPITIIGIGHKSNNDNADGITTISGNISFNEGSSGSAVIGCYISGDIEIGNSGTVTDVMIKCCNMNSVHVRNNSCSNIIINQNFIRSNSFFSGSSGKISNNIIHSVKDVNGGIISNNIFTNSYRYWVSSSYEKYCAIGANNSFISKNIILLGSNASTYYTPTPHDGSNCQINNNMSKFNWGDDYINVGSVDWNDVFVKPIGVNPMSNYNFAEDYSEYSDIGIYGGTGFNDKQIAPVPYIIAKRIEEQTDAAGQLRIQVRVNSGN